MQTSSIIPASSSELPHRPQVRPWRDQLFFAVVERQRKTLSNHRREPERKVFAIYLPPELCSGFHSNGKLDDYHWLSSKEGVDMPTGTQVLLRLDYHPGKSRFIQRCARDQARLVVACLKPDGSFQSNPTAVYKLDLQTITAHLDAGYAKYTELRSSYRLPSASAVLAAATLRANNNAPLPADGARNFIKTPPGSQVSLQRNSAIDTSVTATQVVTRTPPQVPAQNPFHDRNQVKSSSVRSPFHGNTQPAPVVASRAAPVRGSTYQLAIAAQQQQPQQSWRASLARRGLWRQRR